MIFHYFVKVFISSGIIVLVSEIAKKDNLFGGLIASIPLVSVLSMIWLYVDTNDIDKVIETLEESRETMEIYKDTDFVLSNEKTNKVLAVLTMIFTLAIPSTVIGTFYGMNVNLPGGIGENSMVLGPFTTFIVVILASAIPAILMFIYFKKLGWISS